MMDIGSFVETRFIGGVMWSDPTDKSGLYEDEPTDKSGLYEDEPTDKSGLYEEPIYYARANR